MSTVHQLSHPLIQHKLSRLRDKTRSTSGFRTLVREIALLMAYELTRDMPTQEVEIETPLEKMRGLAIDGKKTVLVPILRAGLGLVEGMLALIPGARVGHIGLYRDPKTLVAVEYYFKMPHDMHERDCVVLDPMLATGGSAVAAIDLMKDAGARTIRMICIVAAPEGVALVEQRHPDVLVFTPVIDSHLDAHKYIVPGLGDFGDRLYGTV